MGKELTINRLSQVYPGYLFKDKVLEVCAYNPETGEYVVIDDGCCVTEDGWHCVKYQFIHKDYGMKFFMGNCKHPHPDDAIRIDEERIYEND